jgi:hypothetical protein
VKKQKSPALMKPELLLTDFDWLKAAGSEVKI